MVLDSLVDELILAGCSRDQAEIMIRRLLERDVLAEFSEEGKRCVVLNADSETLQRA